MKEMNAIFVFAGWMVKEPNGKWRTDRVEDQLKAVSGLGGRLRVMAAFHLAEAFPNDRIILSGSKGKFAEVADAPTVSEVMKRELMELGIAETRILKAEKGASTFEELMQLKAIIERHPFHLIVLISNKYHLPRIQTFIKRQQHLRSLLQLWQERRLRIKSAEDILQRYDAPTWNQSIKKFYESDRILEIRRHERKGIQLLNQGKYRYANFDY